ncbi:NAD(P)H-hydrate dehydratase [Moraxella sp. ZJ142]|uniref:NAD(P)H-hydrate dehydratase n=1 Tax=Moraxella marmotae TaxID=3344520 RepID=UPI0035D4F7AE
MTAKHFLTPVYDAKSVKAWEQRWFELGNQSFGLMQQAALAMANTLKSHLKAGSRLCIWCGSGNNGGDGYLLGVYLSAWYQVHIYQVATPSSTDAIQAQQIAKNTLPITNHPVSADVHIDAMFGNGLMRPLSDAWCDVIEQFNAADGQKIAIDLPTGLHPDTGMPLPKCVSVDMTLCLMGYKAGLLMGHAKSHVGQIINHPLIPADNQLSPIASIDNALPKLARHTQHSHQHKGNYGSVMVVGGCATMGGAVIMSAEAAIKTGAGRVTVMTHPAHHAAILARSPNLMLGDIHHICPKQLSAMTAVCIGMGLGRDLWSERVFDEWLAALMDLPITVALDADGLWHLGRDKYQGIRLPSHFIGTPHHAEAGRLLGISADAVESDRIAAIKALQHRYGGQWLLKGANSLTIDDQANVRICTLGNAAMATAGMGDMLSGMMAGILAQAPTATIAAITALHAHCGDLLAKDSLVVDVNQMAVVANRLLAEF